MYQPTVHVHTELDERGRAVTTIIGEVDAATSVQVGEHLARQTLRPDVVDCRFVSFMGAAGLEMLREARSVHPFATATSSAVLRVAELCGLTGQLQLESPSGPPVLHRSTLAVSQHDNALRYVYVNDALATINGLPAQAHYGRRPDELFDVTEDELAPLLTAVAHTRMPRRIFVEGGTAAMRSTWLCTYHPVRYPTATGVMDGVVGTVAAVQQQIRRREPVARLDFDLRATA